MYRVRTEESRGTRRRLTDRPNGISERQDKCIKKLALQEDFFLLNTFLLTFLCNLHKDNIENK